jgi:two-component system chemotaxis response regulator CheY
MPVKSNSETLDINMPKLDGYGFLKELRSIDMPQAPAIMVSTEAEAKDKSRALKAGANLYLIKPVKPDKLLSYVYLLLGGEH